MKLKSIAFAALVATASLATQAAGVIGTGPLPTPSNWTLQGSTSTAGGFDDFWTFVTGAPTFSNAGATSSFVSISGVGSIFQVTNFQAFLDGNPLTSSVAVQNVGPISQTVQSLSIAPIMLSAGSHTLEIKGTTGVTGGGYTATLALAAAPVPEPETYAMMLAGLGALGFVSRRRRNG